MKKVIVTFLQETIENLKEDLCESNNEPLIKIYIATIYGFGLVYYKLQRIW